MGSRMPNIKLLQWNIWYKEDPLKVIKQLKEIDADIICLQELTIGNSLHDKVDTVEMIKDGLDYQVYFKDMVDDEDGKLANAIFSKHSIKNFHYEWINKPTGSGGYDDEYRCYIEATLDIEGKELTVATTHMSYTDRFIETDRKLQESELLLANFKDRKNYIFTGDLNVTPDSKTIKRISEHLKHVGPSFDQPTWTTKPFEYNGFSAVTLDWRLDYVFSSKDITILDTEIIQTNYSDHLPILVDIKI